MYTLLLFFIRLFGDDEHDDVEFTFGSLSKKKEEEKPVAYNCVFELNRGNLCYTLVYLNIISNPFNSLPGCLPLPSPPLPLPPPRPNSPHLYNTRRTAGIEFLCYFSRQFDTRMY